MTHKPFLVGPFTQILTLAGLPLKGALRDNQLECLTDAGIRVRDGVIEAIGPFASMEKEALREGLEVIRIREKAVATPGWVDAHTHTCFAGSRARDYALRNSGSTYLEIAAAGGGIWDTVQQTRKAPENYLENRIVERCRKFATDGVTTLEIKSGYGLHPEGEVKMLRAIQKAGRRTGQDLVATCLAAHMVPRDFKGTPEDYLESLANDLLPVVNSEGLAKRVDIFVEESAFTPGQALVYLKKAAAMGFDLTVHADQFTTGGSRVAIQSGARSADHLEASGPQEVRQLAESGVIAMALPGASLGLGCGYTPARALLDAGAALAIASDYNPGSAPMGDLIAQASILGAAEKLSNAEVLAGVTFRAAAALGLTDRGTLAPGSRADFNIYHTEHYNEITYHQGQLKPHSVWKDGRCILEAKAEGHD